MTATINIQAIPTPILYLESQSKTQPSQTRIIDSPQGDIITDDQGAQILDDI